MSPLSDDPRRRQRQLANLRRGGTVTQANRHRVTHGAYAAVLRDRLDAKRLEVFEALAHDAMIPPGP